MMALSGVRSSWRHVGEELALEPGGPQQLRVLGGQLPLVAPALLQHRGAVEPDHHLVAEGLQQLEIVLRRTARRRGGCRR